MQQLDNLASSQDNMGQGKTQKFKWTDDILKALIDSLQDYKVRMFCNRDFNGDKPKQYEEVR